MSATNSSQASEQLDASTNSIQALAQLEALANSTLFPGRSKGYNRAVRRAARAAAERLMNNNWEDSPEMPEIKPEYKAEAAGDVKYNNNSGMVNTEDPEVKLEDVSGEPEVLVVPVKFEVRLVTFLNHFFITFLLLATGTVLATNYIRVGKVSGLALFKRKQVMLATNY